MVGRGWGHGQFCSYVKASCRLVDTAVFTSLQKYYLHNKTAGENVTGDYFEPNDWLLQQTETEIASLGMMVSDIF